jgi:D-cysteine desulfhydrase
LSLGRFPSPLQSYPALASELGFGSLVVKHEDQNGPVVGGNKIRALEWILPDVGPSIVTFGGFGSTYAAALSYCAERTGQKVTVALFPQPWVDYVPATLASTASRAQVFLARSRWSLPLTVARAWLHASRYGSVSWLPAGGATPLGVLGSVGAALEFVGQVETGESPPPDVIVVPLGSGGTGAGLLIGCWIAGWNTVVCGVRVAPRIVANHWHVMHLVRRTCRLLHRCGLRVQRGPATFRLLHDQFGPGYGMPTAAAIAMQRRAGEADLALELTYGAKAFAALRGLSSSFRAPCFWHTFDRRIAGPVADTPLLQTARAYAESLWPHPRSN